MGLYVHVLSNGLFSRRSLRYSLCWRDGVDDGVNGVDWWSVYGHGGLETRAIYSFERMVMEAMWMLTLPDNK